MMTLATAKARGSDEREGKIAGIAPSDNRRPGWKDSEFAAVDADTPLRRCSEHETRFKRSNIDSRMSS